MVKKRDRLVAEGHRMIVYIPVELRERLKRVAFERSAGMKGYMSLGAVVRELLAEAVDDDGPKGKRKGKPMRSLDTVDAPSSTAVESVDQGQVASVQVQVDLRRADAPMPREIANRPRILAIFRQHREERPAQVMRARRRQTRVGTCAA